jgi:sugar diacid utilization regulator
MDELQMLVDALASTLDRPVDVDDRFFRVLSYSSHTEGVDRVRLASILQREAPAEVTGWLESLGVREAERYARVPANAAFGMAARVCFPIRFDGVLLGYLWLIDEPVALSQAELECALGFVDELSAVLFRVWRIDQGDRQRERELLAKLLQNPSEGEAAGAMLLGSGLLSPAPTHAVIVTQAVHAEGTASAPDVIRARVVAAAERVRRTRGLHDVLVLVVAEQAVMVVAELQAKESEVCADHLLAGVTASLSAAPEWSALVGVGEPRDDVSRLRESYAEAQRAVWLARRVPAFRPLARWQDAGAYRILAQLIQGGRGPMELSPAFARVLSHSDGQMLIATAECYLDHAGDVRAAARELGLHRSSLYDRLRRIERVAGIDLSSGERRLELHLAIRLWRLERASM